MVPESEATRSTSHYNQQFFFETSAAPKPKKPRSKAFKKLRDGATSAVVIASVVGASVGAGAGITFTVLNAGSKTVIVNNAQSVNWVTAAAAKAEPSVVTISVTSPQASGSGSGVVLTEDGYILTNTHVVTMDGATASPVIEVKTNNDEVYSARVVGTDPTNDLAVIKITPKGSLVPIKFADSTKVNVGDGMIAIGAPLGLEKTVTSGIVSALDRTIQVANSSAPENGSTGSGGLQLWNGTTGKPAINITVIQTDAAINPGNSGGALVNQNGELVGINVAIASAGSTSGQAGSIGVGFAIPSNTAHRISNELMKTGTASHAMLGANVSDAASSSGNFSTGAKVESVKAGSAADQAGLQAGDVVIKFNGRDIANASDLTAAVRQQPAGAKANLEIIRKGATLNVAVTLGNAADLNK
ncbi:MAG: hypothetical protein RL556_615 [Actinomycetota bacterium]